LLEVGDLTVRYEGALALDGVSLMVRDGEAVSLIGPNGAGKTSLLRAISGLIPYSGTILFRGVSLGGLQPHRIVHMGVVHCPEAGELYPEMTVQENLDLGAYTMRDRRVVRENLGRVYELFPQLADRSGQIAGTLSGGERQMLAIGRSLMSRPTLLMLDEPSLGLGPILRDRIQASIQRIHREWNLSIVLVEQDSMLALEVTSRVYVMDSGRIVRDGSPEAIMRDPMIREVYLGIS
jgi:branched-chain amino acid transport system ATP-binding protein